MQSGPLVASPPALALGDVLVSLTLGVTLYGETLRGGWWLAIQLLCVALAATGVTGLSHSHTPCGHPGGTVETAVPTGPKTAMASVPDHGAAYARDSQSKPWFRTSLRNRRRGRTFPGKTARSA
jgi:hypothetical protein